jgi:hypothetical protein
MYWLVLLSIKAGVRGLFSKKKCEVGAHPFVKAYMFHKCPLPNPRCAHNGKHGGTSIAGNVWLEQEIEDGFLLHLSAEHDPVEDKYVLYGCLQMRGYDPRSTANSFMSPISVSKPSSIFSSFLRLSALSIVFCRYP